MKKVLLATSALFLTAGVASAELAISGTAGAGIVQNGTGADTTVWSGVDINLSASATTDGGVTISMSDDIGGGNLIDWNDDYAVDAQGTTIGAPAVTINSGALTITFDNNAIDHLDSDASQGDVKVSAAMGGATVDIVVDTDQDNGTNATTGAANPQTDYSYKLGYTMGDLAGTYTAQDDSSKLSVSYTMGAVKVGVSSDDNGAGVTTNEASVSYTAGGLTLTGAADDQDGWDADVAYTAGAMSVAFGTDETEEWDLNASYDLGGGVAAKASLTSGDFMAAGLTFSF
jgi:outer membrane protein OmpU